MSTTTPPWYVRAQNDRVNQYLWHSHLLRIGVVQHDSLLKSTHRRWRKQEVAPGIERCPADLNNRDTWDEMHP
jgi:hypothetical protein